MQNIRLLDCTLRDGGYINDWNFGFENIRDIVSSLTRAGVDIVEVGFLRNVDYDPDRTRWNTVKELKHPARRPAQCVLFSGMALHNFLQPRQARTLGRHRRRPDPGHLPRLRHHRGPGVLPQGPGKGL